MDIKCILDNKEEKIIDLSEYTCGVTSQRFFNETTGDEILLKDISKIFFNEKNFFMQMVDGIKDMCIIEFEDSGKEIILGTYNG